MAHPYTVSARITVVLEYPAEKDLPQFHAGIEALGGEVVAVQFSDALRELEELTGNV